MFFVFLLSFAAMTLTIILASLIPSFLPTATFILGYLQLLPIWCVIYLHKQPKQDENEGVRATTFIKKTEVQQPVGFLKPDKIQIVFPEKEKL